MIVWGVGGVCLKVFGGAHGLLPCLAAFASFGPVVTHVWALLLLQGAVSLRCLISVRGDKQRWCVSTRTRMQGGRSTGATAPDL